MSLVDTWAATGAGAFTLSENGLYTREAWRIFLDRLTPTGVLSVSRWFSPAAHLGDEPADGAGGRRAARARHRTGRSTTWRWSRVTTWPRCWCRRRRCRRRISRTLEATSQARGFTVLAVAAAAPVRPAAGRDRAEPVDGGTGGGHRRRPSTTIGRPPTRGRSSSTWCGPAAWWRASTATDGGVIAGNLRATSTLIAILGVSLAFVVGTIVVPLAVRGRPALPARRLTAGLAYFAVIGTAFMLAQVAFLQRFSVLLGHPTYALVVVLFSMILFAGLGSFASAAVLGPGGRRFGRVRGGARRRPGRHRRDHRPALRRRRGLAAGGARGHGAGGDRVRCRC